MSFVPPIVAAHRGLHTRWPENSLAAFRAAWEAGMIWNELDVHLSADLHPVVIHDETLDRTTNQSGRVDARPLENLKACLLRFPNGVMSSEPIPSLAEVVEQTPPAGRLMIELKSADCPDLITSVLQLVQNRTVLIQSFDPAHLLRAGRLAPDMPVALLTEDASALADAMECAWPAVYCLHELLTESTVARLKGSKKSVGAWTVNDARDMRRMLTLGVDVIITDDPVGVQAAIGDFERKGR